MENPIKMDDLQGKPLFSETSIYMMISWSSICWTADPENANQVPNFNFYVYIYIYVVYIIM